jgi:dTMP kinase
VNGHGQVGRLLSFEGLDGCGKGTQLDGVECWLRERGHVVERFREPGGSAVSEAIRSILLDPAHEALAGETELLLFTAARVQLLKERVLPALARGRVVLLDRFADSTTAYQGYGRRLPLGMVESLNQLVRALAWPERTFWLDLDPALALARAGATDRMERAGLDFFRRVREGYLALAEAEPARVQRVDASGTPEDVFARMEPELTRLFAGRKDPS